jgi:hypothetical protein
MDRVLAVNKVVFEKTEKACFLLHDCPALNSLFDISGQVEDTIPVECIAIDELLDENVRVDVIKIDIQGAELHDPKGMVQTIKRASVRLRIFAECWPQGLLMAGNSAGDLVKHLRELGLTLMIIDEQNHCLSPVGPDIEQMKEVNLYCKGCKDAL